MFLLVGMSTLASREIRHHFGLTELESVWKGEQPDRIVFATSSVRKAVIFSWAINNFSFDFLSQTDLQIKGPGLEGLTTPQEIQEYFNEYIYNGDMALTHPVELGEFEGVPVWAFPQVGETESNEDPVAESVNKVTHFGTEFGDEKVLIVSSDVVGTSSAFVNPEKIIKMGKPVNFKRQIEADTQAESEAPVWSSLDEFAAWYKEVVFQVGAELGHISGIAVLNAQDQALYTAQLRLFHQVSEELHEYLEVYMDAGLGGAWQQIQLFYERTLDVLAQAAEDIVPTEILEVTQSELPLPQAEELVEQYTYAHMIGVQVLAFLELLVGAQRQEIDVLAAQHGYTVTLFDGGTK